MATKRTKFRNVVTLPNGKASAFRSVRRYTHAVVVDEHDASAPAYTVAQWCESEDAARIALDDQSGRIGGTAFIATVSS